MSQLHFDDDSDNGDTGSPRPEKPLSNTKSTKPQSNPECQICFNNFNKSSRKLCVCPYCSFEVCQNCFKIMMIENGEECAECKKAWSTEFIKANTTKVWFDSDYKEKRKLQMYEREKSILQTAIPIVKAEQYKEKANEQIKKINDQIKLLQEQKTHIELNLQHNRARMQQGLDPENLDFDEKKEVKAAEDEKYKTIPVICKYITIFHNVHEDAIELSLFINDLCNVLKSDIET